MNAIPPRHKIQLWLDGRSKGGLQSHITRNSDETKWEVRLRFFMVHVLNNKSERNEFFSAHLKSH